MLCSLALLGLCDSKTQSLQICERIVRTEGEPETFIRRLDMISRLVGEKKSRDWAVNMGLISLTTVLDS